MANQEELLQIRNLMEEVFRYMNFNLKTSVFAGRDEIQINVSGNDRAYLTTDNGETLLSLQYILSKMIRQKIPSVAGFRIVVDSDGYMFRHEQELRRLAGRAIQRVRRERRRVTLPPLNPYDRRIVHMEVSRNDDLDSVSEGEGFFKKVVVQRKF